MHKYQQKYFYEISYLAELSNNYMYFQPSFGWDWLDFFTLWHCYNIPGHTYSSAFCQLHYLQYTHHEHIHGGMFSLLIPIYFFLN